MNFDLKALCEQAGVALYDDELVSENGRKIYRIYIAKKGGVSLNECVKVSEILSPILDAYPPCADEYALEVSSPGLERKLTKPQHFELSINERVEIILNDKGKFVGEILGVSQGKKLCLLDENGAKKELELREIKRAKTLVEW